MRYAAHLAAPLGDVRLVLLHVDQLPTYGLPEGSILDASTREEWTRRLDALATLSSATIEIETAVRQGRAHSGILEAADELGAELIVMGSTGHSSLQAALLGSVTEKTMRLSPIPVVVIPSGSAPPPTGARSALLPVDVSAEHSVEATHRAIRAAVALGAEQARLLHVFEVPLSLALMADRPRRAQAVASLRARERARLSSLEGLCQDRGVELETAFTEGVVHGEIARRAMTDDFDLIVMPTHARHALGQLLLGSVVAKVVRTATMPVCALRIPEILGPS
ncbi:MAG: universal stress protein [Sandaracinaceae bacterium]|nr:universal stress protein [Sandaracinaceae bacterium]